MAYFRETFKGILKVKDTPHRIALAFALGVFMGISPLLGLHYILGIFFAWLLRLNKLVAIVGVSVNNPWTIVPISTFCVWIGAKILGIRQVLPDVDWKNLSLVAIAKNVTDLDRLLAVTAELMPLIKAFFAGSFLICTLSAVVSYFVVHSLASKYRSLKNAA
jgi:uncharacterized protein (DUF2062 family)